MISGLGQKNVTKLRFSCLPLESQYSRRQGLVGKERLLYSGDRQPGEKADLCPRANSEDSAPP